MNKLRFFGLLATVLLLAFGLALSCDNGTTTTEQKEEPYVNIFETATHQIKFSNAEISAKARAVTTPQNGDFYVIIEKPIPPGNVISSGKVAVASDGKITLSQSFPKPVLTP